MNTEQLNVAQSVLKQFGSDLNKEDLAMMVSTTKGAIDENGNMSLDGINDLFRQLGVAATVQNNANMLDLSYELSNGRQVLVEIDSDELHSNSLFAWLKDFFFGSTPDKVMIMAGLDYSNPGNPKVTLVDPTNESKIETVDLEHFLDSWKDSHCMMLATAIPPQQTLKMFEDAGLKEPHLPEVHHIEYADLEAAHTIGQAQEDMKDIFNSNIQNTYDMMNFQLFCAQNEGGIDAIKQYLDNHPITPRENPMKFWDHMPNTSEHSVNGVHYSTDPNVMIGEALGDHSHNNSPEQIAIKEEAVKKLTDMAANAGLRAFRARLDGDIYGAVGWAEADYSAQRSIHDIIYND